MSQATELRVFGAALGFALLVVLPATLMWPWLGGEVAFSALPEWAPAASIGSAVLGAWHIATAALALDEDLDFITGYFQAHEAAPLVLPFALFVGTRSVYRRLFAPACVARRRWLARRKGPRQCDT